MILATRMSIIYLVKFMIKNKFLAAGFGTFLMLSAAMPAQAAALSQAQIDAIVGLLTSFGASPTVITNVSAALAGRSIPDPTPTSATLTSCVNLARDMHAGSTDIGTGGEVSKLQNYLIANGLMTGSATGYYGLYTAQAVGTLQISVGIVASTADLAYGYTGPRTRAVISCSYNTAPSISVTGVTNLNIVVDYKNLPVNSQIWIDNASTGERYTAQSTLINRAGSSVGYNIPIPSGLPSGTYKLQVVKYEAPTLNIATSNTFQITSGTASGTPTATLAANGSDNITVNIGSTIDFAWNSTNGVSWSTAVTESPDDTCNTNPFAGVGTNANDPSQLVFVSGCQAGSTYTIEYTVTGSNNQTAKDTVVVHVNPENTSAAPTATLLVDNQNGTTGWVPEITINPGDSITYKWESTNAATAKSSYTIAGGTDTCSVLVGGTGPFDLTVTTTGGTATKTNVSSCRAGHTYTVTYTVTSASGATASDSVVIHVNNSSVSLSALPATAIAGTNVTISWAGLPNPNRYDWIGMYRADATSYMNTQLAYRYLGCTVAPSTGVSSGSCSYAVPAGLAAGSYKFVLFKTGTYTPVATSNTITVTAATQ
jgi:hypothetical protein